MAELLFWPALLAYGEAAVAYLNDVRHPGLAGRLATWGVRVGWLVQTALLELPEDYRQAIMLRHFLHRSHQEMSELMGVPEKTVKSRLYTARQLLAKALGRRGVTSE